MQLKYLNRSLTGDITVAYLLHFHYTLEVGK
uniref:Uncharacterized protein n=1 Tax=Anguilla anguilla TaxID=7936 RepID=A0A0E9VSX2_ANGAN